MGFLAELQENSEKLETIYDVAAFCYDYIKQKIEDEEYFIGKYIGENSKAENSNPNIEMLKEFSSNVEQVLRKQTRLAWSTARCLKSIEEYITKLEARLMPYGTEAQNELTVPYCVLQAIDRHVYREWYPKQAHAPLNTKYCENSYVYLGSSHSMIEEAQVQIEFPEVIHGMQIRHQLSNLIILDRKTLPNGVGIPKVVPLWINEEDGERRKIVNGRILKVAIIPFGEECMVDFPPKEGGVFYVSYMEKHKRDGVDRAVRLLDSAIREKANIIIFPEFVCTEEVQESIRKRLEELYETNEKALSSLLLVVAGSGWSEDNNIAKIYSYSGKLLGRQYKYTRYCKAGNKNLLEGLTSPGKESTIVDIEGMGRIQVGICRDVSERGYAYTLAEAFRPFLLLVPAWSRSVNNGFSEQFREIIACNHTTSAILCNCCEALRSEKEFREQVGIICTPYKDDTVVRGKENSIMRKVGCDKTCARGACIFMVEMGYDKNAVEKKQIVQRIQQKFVI